MSELQTHPESLAVRSLILHVATSNPGKLRDFALAAALRHDAASVPAVQFATLPGLATLPAPDEDQDTFEGNARLKAIYYSQAAAGLLVMADDSGLEVHALDGRPGVRSARFAADLGFDTSANTVDAANNEALLLQMTEQTDRRARYRCVLALARDGVVLHTAQGSLEGEILVDPQGSGGFGYDPLFFVPEIGCTMAQATAQQRLAMSHRGHALRHMLADLPHAVLDQARSHIAHPHR